MTNVEGAVSGPCPLLLTEQDAMPVRGWTSPEPWLWKLRRARGLPLPRGQ